MVATVAFKFAVSKIPPQSAPVLGGFAIGTNGIFGTNGTIRLEWFQRDNRDKVKGKDHVTDSGRAPACAPPRC